MSSFVVIEDDILHYVGNERYYVCHQCNCKSSYALGLAKYIFELVPAAGYDVIPAGCRRPGRIDIVDNVVNMYAQVWPGSPERSSSWSQLDQNRIALFISCLSHIPDDRIAVFPWHIGCGLAGGTWSAYETVLRDWAAERKHAVFIIKLVD
jgi:hypothetical protein